LSEFVSGRSAFTSPLPETFAFPAACCVCGIPSTHKQTIQHSTQNASSAVTAPTVGLTTSTRISVEVPHCADHKNGASLTGNPKSMHIRFRSYPCLRAFRALNKTIPG
jgi:hypothetical protein